MISVIVPVYKVEKYLDRCILSLVNQTYTDLEIILVDDGSPDNCPQKCEEWVKKDNRIKVIHKKNEGLGYARNTGMEIATGEWITFVDSDDYVHLFTYELCMKKLLKSQADVCFFSSTTVIHDRKLENKFIFPNTLEGDEIRKELLPKCFGRYDEDRYDLGSACMGIYKKSLIDENNINFVSERMLISEDNVFITEICYVARKIVFLNEPFYFYCMNDTSLSHSYRADRYEKIVIYYENRLEKIKELNLGNEALTRAGINYWSLVIGCLKQEIKSSKINFKQKIGRIRQICVNEITKKLICKSILKHVNLPQKILLFLMKKRLYYLIYILIKVRYMNE